MSSHHAFVNHPWTRAIYPTQDAAGNIERYKMRQTKGMQDPKSTFFVAVNGAEDDPKAPVVGYSKWTINRESQAENVWNVPYETVPVPIGGRQDASDVPGEALHQMRLRVYKGDPYILLHFLVADVDHQRKGIGGKLLKWGLQQSDETGLPAYLEATHDGYPLYYKNGFRTVDEMSVDTAPWGLEEPIELKCMKHEPGSRSGTR